MKLSLLPLAIAAALVACKSPTNSTSDAGPTAPVFDPPPPDGDILGGADCDSLVPTQCGYPYPSSVYLVADTSMVTGKHIQFRPHTLPVIGGKNTDPSTFTRYDGFSPSTAALTHMPGATATGLPDQNHIDLSVTAQSPTIFMEVNRDGTWRLIPHFAELDVSTSALNPDNETLIIHPVIRLNDNARYIIAIRNVVDSTGTPLAPTPVFQALRDGTSSSDASVAARRGLYQNIFANLKFAGVDSSNLQLAWDYYTTSRQNVTSDLITLRDQALSVVGAQGPTYTKDKITMNPNQWIYKRIEGTMHVPWYLTIAPTSTGQQPSIFGNGPTQYTTPCLQPGGLLNYNSAGQVTQNGFCDYPYILQIPNSLMQPGAAPGGVLQNAHGLLGAETEGEDDYWARLSDEGGYVGIAVNLWGFDHNYVGIAEVTVQEDAKYFLQMVDGQDQGIVNELLAMRMMIGGMVADPDLQSCPETDGGQPDGTCPTGSGHSIIDPTKAYYRGDSQGGIMGGTYMSVTTDVTRGYLGEPGFPYNIILNRSSDFGAYYFLVEQAYGVYAGPPCTMTMKDAPGCRTPQLALGILQQMWDRSEPTGFAPYMTQANVFPNTPSHAVIINDGLGDHQVNPLGAHILARTVGAKMMQPANREVYGIEDATGPVTDGGSAITEFNFQLDQNPNVILPQVDSPPVDTGSMQENGIGVTCDPHDKIREEAAVFMQTEKFFNTGEIDNFCTGQNLRPAFDTLPDGGMSPVSLPDGGLAIPGSCQFDYTIPYVPAATPTACTPG